MLSHSPLFLISDTVNFFVHTYLFPQNPVSICMAVLTALKTKHVFKHVPLGGEECVQSILAVLGFLIIALNDIPWVLNVIPALSCFVRIFEVLLMRIIECVRLPSFIQIHDMRRHGDDDDGDSDDGDSDDDEEEMISLDETRLAIYNGDGETGICSICREYFNTGDHLRILECDHCFHVNCIDVWLSRHHHCPLCRQNIN